MSSSAAVADAASATAAPEWRKCSLASVAEVTVGHVGPMAHEYVPDGIPFLRSQDLAPLRIRTRDVKYITPEFHQKLRKSALAPGDIVIVRTGRPGTAAVIPDELPVANCADLVIVRPGPDLHPRFLAYYLNSAAAGYVSAHLVGAVQQHFNVTSAKALTLHLPPLAEQQRIVSVLGPLDDKIDSNARTAARLEEAAATLYYGWFVLGAGPEVPEHRSVYDVATVTYGAPFKSALFGEDGVPLLRIRDLGKDQPGVRTTEERPGARLVQRRDLVVGMDGEFRVHPWHGPAAWLNQRVCAFDPLPGVSRVFLYEALKKPLAFFEATKGGTTVIHLGKKDIDTFELPTLGPDGMRAFAEAADPLLDLAVALRAEARQLAAVRDELLPRLVAGRLCVPHVDATDDFAGLDET